MKIHCSSVVKAFLPVIGITSGQCQINVCVPCAYVFGKHKKPFPSGAKSLSTLYMNIIMALLQMFSEFLSFCNFADKPFSKESRMVEKYKKNWFNKGLSD